MPLDVTQNRMDWRLLVKECIVKIAKLRNLFWESFDNSQRFELSFEFLANLVISPKNILCIVGHLEGGGSVAVGFIGFGTTIRKH